MADLTKETNEISEKLKNLDPVNLQSTIVTYKNIVNDLEQQVKILSQSLIKKEKIISHHQERFHQIMQNIKVLKGKSSIRNFSDKF